MITAESLFKNFDGFCALKGVNFTIDDGSIYGLVGSNGSGKSTLLRLISGVYKADGGSLTVDGDEVFNNPLAKSKIAFLGDTPYFLPQSDLNDMARFYSSLYPGFDYGEYKRLLGIFPLNCRAGLSGFSKGMQRQAALILALSLHPKYLLLDEAFDGLDVVMRRVLANLIIEGSQDKGMTVIISSHNLRELEDLCDHIALIHEGNMLVSGSIENLVGNIHKIQAVFSAVPEASVFDKLNVLKFERSGSLVQLVVRGDENEIMGYINKLSPTFAESIEPTLEEIFVYELEVMGYDVKNILS